jgi:D-beta-D-heptose 7-phosphate kinase/D-beta-D-heptose 1-phosphate adenosyltransferase
VRDHQQLVPVIERLASAVIACVGDVMLDCWVQGEVGRISPEAPIPVLRVARSQRMPGGAGNAARNLSALGCRVRFFSAAGDDAEAGDISELLKSLPGVKAFVEREPGRQTPVKTRYIANGQQLLRADTETTGPFRPATAANLLAAFFASVPACSIVLLSDYAKGVLDGPLAQEFIGAARAAGKPVIVDPKGRDFSRYRGALLIKPNLRELGEATGLPVDGDDAQEFAARKLLRDTEAEYILVTRGAAGMLLTPAGGPAVHFPALAREIYDVSGAGDTVAAVLTAALGSGASVSDAVETANIAAGIVVGKVGTAVAGRAEIIHQIRQYSAIGASDKVLELAEAVELARGWRQAGLSVGFTNGCFDLLHPGHLKLLEAARSRCDRLLVGLNGDESVRRLKGPSRPIQSESARALVLASLNCVDGVVVFGEDTPRELILALRPDLLVKGGEYKPENVVGADLVESWGGRLLLVDMVDGWSTTATVSRLTGVNS